MLVDTYLCARRTKLLESLEYATKKFKRTVTLIQATAFFLLIFNNSPSFLPITSIASLNFTLNVIVINFIFVFGDGRMFIYIYITQSPNGCSFCLCGAISGAQSILACTTNREVNMCQKNCFVCGT